MWSIMWRIWFGAHEAQTLRFVGVSELVAGTFGEHHVTASANGLLISHTPSMCYSLRLS